MQRLALAVLLVGAVIALLAVAARATVNASRATKTGSGAVQPWRNGMVERVAYIILLGLIFGTSIGWLGDL